MKFNPQCKSINSSLEINAKSHLMSFDVSGMNTLGKGEKQRGAQTEVVSLVL